jgi:hypothetical protein
LVVVTTGLAALACFGACFFSLALGAFWASTEVVTKAALMTAAINCLRSMISVIGLAPKVSVF